MGKLAGAVVCWGIAVLFFYAAFFKIAPWLASMVPVGDWAGLATAAVYVVIAYLGGIGLPVALIFLGFYILISD